MTTIPVSFFFFLVSHANLLIYSSVLSLRVRPVEARTVFQETRCCFVGIFFYSSLLFFFFFHDAPPEIRGCDGCAVPRVVVLFRITFSG